MPCLGSPSRPSQSEIQAEFAKGCFPWIRSSYHLWFDVGTKRVKIATHVRFDEGMNDLPFESIPPNVQHLQRVDDGKLLAAETEVTSADEFQFYLHPFANLVSKTLKKSCTKSPPTIFRSTRTFEPLCRRKVLPSSFLRSFEACVHSNHCAEEKCFQAPFFATCCQEQDPTRLFFCRNQW